MTVSHTKVKFFLGTFIILLSIANLIFLFFAYRQIKNSEAISAGDRSAELIKVIYEREDCPHLPCKPKADIRLREDAVKTYVNRERFYGNIAHLQKADLRYTDLSGIDFSNVNLSTANLEGANLSNSTLAHTNLQMSNLRGVRLTEANLFSADLSFASLEGADLTGAKAVGVILRGAQLGVCAEQEFESSTGQSNEQSHSAVLRYTDLKNADLDNAILCRADLRGSYLSGATHLTQRQLDSAIGNHETIIPAFLVRPKHWRD